MIERLCAKDLRRFTVPGRLTPVSWQLPQSLSYENWLACGKNLIQLGRAIQWALGDWWVHGEHAYGERVAALREEAFGDYTWQTLMNLGWVARRVKTSRRREVLSFTHHATVAALPAAEQEHWLDRAERGEQDENGERRPWSVSQLRMEIRAATPPEDPPEEEEEDEPESAAESDDRAAALAATGARIQGLPPVEEQPTESVVEEEEEEEQPEYLMALVGRAEACAERILQQLERNPGVASVDGLLEAARSVVELWSTVVTKLEARR